MNPHPSNKYPLSHALWEIDNNPTRRIIADVLTLAGAASIGLVILACLVLAWGAM